MKRETSQLMTRTARLCGLLAICLLLADCGNNGGEQSAGVGGTGIVYGKITGFGSIYVNGGEYDTDGSMFTVDGNTAATQDDLALGMVVRLKVRTENGKLGLKAIEVDYEDDVQGPIEANPRVVPGTGGSQKTFDVFGLQVTVDEFGTLFRNTSFHALAAGDVVEISGFRTAADAVRATYVDKKETLLVGSEVEIRGVIENFSAGPPEIFDIGGFPIRTDGNTVADVGGMLHNGLLVDVKGKVANLAPLTILAKEIDRQEEGFGDHVEEASLQGIVSGFTSLGDFRINGQQVDASGARLNPTNAASLLGDGVEVEVQGEIVAGVLIADQLELHGSGSKLRAPVDSVDPANNRFELSYPVVTGPTNVVVRVDSQTTFEDETGAVPATPPFSLDDLTGGMVDFVRVEGQQVNGEVLARVVKRTRPDDKLRLEGTVDAVAAGVSITVLGVAYQVDSATEYEPRPPNIVSGDRVEIEDKNDPLPADGVADVVEKED